MLVLDILRYIAIGVGLIIVFVGFILVILAESAPERMIDFLETLALAMLGRRAPRRRRRIYAVRAPAEERVVEPLAHEHHELVLQHHRRRRIPWRLVGAVLLPLLTFLMGYPLVHPTARLAKTQCPPTQNAEVLLTAHPVNVIPAQKQGDSPCPAATGAGLCGLLERNVPFLEPILVALHVCPEPRPAVVTTIYAVSHTRETPPDPQ